MDAAKTCALCAAFSGLAKECRAKSPSVHVIITPNGPVTLGVFPPTKPDNWCGEWRGGETPALAN